ncbi:MAG: maleylpyruvate isomerase N-terminal domain-containing protein [Balneolaceae bacterium]
MKPLPETDALPVFKDVQSELLSLLRSMSAEEWNYPASSRSWNVKDIVAHLLDGDLRRLSLHRDGHVLPEPSSPVNSYSSLVTYLNELNNTWVSASKRLSPTLLIELIEFITPEVVKHLKSLDPKGTALFSVGWADEEESENWFDIAREYTEKWHHQQQIREATGKPLLVEGKWLIPLIDTLIRGVPPVYQQFAAPIENERLKININGVISDSWILTCRINRWQLFKADTDQTNNQVEMDDDTAWRMFTKNITEHEALNRIEVTGDQKLGKLIAKTVSFMK